MSLFERITDLLTKSSSNVDYFIEVDKAAEAKTEKMLVTDLVQDLSLSGVDLGISGGTGVDLSTIQMVKNEKIGGYLEVNSVTLPLKIKLTTALKISIDSKIVNISSDLRKNFTTAWVAGTNNGGLDTGTFTPNRMYDIYIIADSAGLNGDLLFVLEGNTPTMPTGYTLNVFFSKYKTSYNLAVSATIDKIYQGFEFTEGYFKNPYVENHINGFEIEKYFFNVVFKTGQARDNSNSINIDQNSEIDKNTSLFAEGDGAGMFESAIAINTLYYLYVILGDNGRVDYLASTTLPPTLPTNFNYYKLVGFLMTDVNTTDLIVWTVSEKWEDENFDVTSIGKDNSIDPTAPTYEDLFGNGIKVACFSPIVDQYVSVGKEFAHGGKNNSPIEFHGHFYPEDATIGDVCFFVDYVISPVGDAIPSTATRITKICTTQGVAGKHHMFDFDFLFGLDLTEGTQIWFKFGREATNVLDTYTKKIAGRTFGYHYIKDKLGSDLETSDL